MKRTYRVALGLVAGNLSLVPEYLASADRPEGAARLAVVRWLGLTGLQWETKGEWNDGAWLYSFGAVVVQVRAPEGAPRLPRPSWNRMGAAGAFGPVEGPALS